MATLTYSYNELNAMNNTIALLMQTTGNNVDARIVRNMLPETICNQVGNGSFVDPETGTVTLVIAEDKLLALLKATDESITDAAPLLIAGYQLYLAFKTTMKRVEQRFITVFHKL